MPPPHWTRTPSGVGIPITAPLRFEKQADLNSVTVSGQYANSAPDSPASTAEKIHCLTIFIWEFSQREILPIRVNLFFSVTLKQGKREKRGNTVRGCSSPEK